LLGTNRVVQADGLRRRGGKTLDEAVSREEAGIQVQRDLLLRLEAEPSPAPLILSSQAEAVSGRIESEATKLATAGWLT
jgi:NADH pyrophosphatase NudC (nudix superfamily)